jgi:uncharacterized protein
MIIEGLLTTTNTDGSPHVAPMGPLVDPALSQWRLRPFQSSTTFQNLRRHNICVFHVIDDVVPLVQSALSISTQLTYHPTPEEGWVIDTACHWYCLRAADWDLSQDRSQVTCEMASNGQLRPFWGWNRAKHAILEVTILATRLNLTGIEPIENEVKRLSVIVEKTAGPRELEAWAILHEFLEQSRTG